MPLTREDAVTRAATLFSHGQPYDEHRDENAYSTRNYWRLSLRAYRNWRKDGRVECRIRAFGKLIGAGATWDEAVQDMLARYAEWTKHEGRRLVKPHEEQERYYAQVRKIVFNRYGVRVEDSQLYFDSGISPERWADQFARKYNLKPLLPV